MRPYNPATDYLIIADAISRYRPGDGLLTLACRALQASGIQWPANFNTNRDEAALAIDRDIVRAWEAQQGLRATE